MRTSAVLGLALLVIVAILAAVAGATMYRVPDRHPGDGFPPLALASLDGSSTTFAGRGRPAIVTVFATWCVPCREEVGAIAAMSNSPLGRKVEFVEIDWNEPAARVQAFLTRYPNLRATVLIDRTHAVNALGIYSVPRTLALSAGGRITGQFDGAMGPGDLRTLIAGTARKRLR